MIKDLSLASLCVFSFDILAQREMCGTAVNCVNFISQRQCDH